MHGPTAGNLSAYQEVRDVGSEVVESEVVGSERDGRGRVARRLTGSAMVVLGLGNLVLGVLVVAGVGSLLETAPATGWGLVVAGPVLAALGVWLWRGGVTAARVALGVVLALLVANAATASASTGAAGRTVLLIALAVGCGLGARPEAGGAPER